MNKFTVIYDGGDADRHHLRLYDASISYQGLARTLAIIGHYYITGEHVYKATASKMPLYLETSEDGSFKQNVAAATVAGIIIIPFNFFGQRLMETWIPSSPNPQMEKMIDLLKEQNKILSQEKVDQADALKYKYEEKFQEFMIEKEKDILKLRAITSRSFRGIYRPVQTGTAKRIGITSDAPIYPTRAVDKDVLGKLSTDFLDDKVVSLRGVVNSFSRSSKSGFIFSQDTKSGFRFEFSSDENIERNDDFSWSQFEQKPIRISGSFVRYFDGKIKRFLVYHAERVEDQSEIDEYYSAMKN